MSATASAYRENRPQIGLTRLTMATFSGASTVVADLQRSARLGARTLQPRRSAGEHHAGMSAVPGMRIR